MNIRDILTNPDIDLDMEIAVNVDGFILPIENIIKKDDKTVLIISASSLEDRYNEGKT